MITFKQYLLNEGGAAGHMDHPFDLPGANTGKDLIKIFQNVVLSLKSNPSSVKIDGINCSLKLINGEAGKEFAMDQGAKMEMDVLGVTQKNIEQRFKPSKTGEPHGMIAKGKTVLNIFNTSLPNIADELKKLGLYNNDHLILNMEFVEGHTNVIGYANNFLAIHGINELPRLASLARGSGTRKSVEVKYDKKALQSLVEKVKPVAQKNGFNIVGEFPVEVSADIDITPALISTFTVNYDGQHQATKTLQTWLQAAKNPRGTRIVLANGRNIGAMSLENYKNVISGNPVSRMLKNPVKKNIQSSIDGAVFYHAAIILGEQIKQQAKSELGVLTTQEGIVIRDSKISSKPFKITGNFILGKEQGLIRQKKSEGEEGVAGYTGNMLYANTTGNSLNAVNYVTRPPYTSPVRT